MLPELPSEMRAAQALGVSEFRFAGEAEDGGSMQVLQRCAIAAQLQPLYDYMNDLPRS